MKPSKSILKSWQDTVQLKCNRKIYFVCSVCNRVFMYKSFIVVTGVFAQDLLCFSKFNEAWCVSTRLECYAASHQPVSIYSFTRVTVYTGAQLWKLGKCLAFNGNNSKKSSPQIKMNKCTLSLNNNSNIYNTLRGSFIPWVFKITSCVKTCKTFCWPTFCFGQKDWPYSTCLMRQRSQWDTRLIENEFKGKISQAT